MYEELFNQAMSGDVDALEKINNIANSGNAEAQYVLSCVYTNLNSPFKDISLGMYWLRKSADYKYKPAMQKIKELSTDTEDHNGHDINNENTTSESEGNTINNTRSDSIWSFKGRIDKTTYLVYFIVFLFVFGITLYLIGQIPLEKVTERHGYIAYVTMQPTEFAIWSGNIVRLVSLYLFSALMVKRLHDCGYSGWWILIPLCPIALFFMDTEKKDNKYGPLSN